MIIVQVWPSFASQHVGVLATFFHVRWELGNPVLGRAFQMDFYHHVKGYVQLKILVVLTIKTGGRGGLALLPIGSLFKDPGPYRDLFANMGPY